MKKMSGTPATINFVALASSVIGCAIPYWEYHGNILGQIHIGLWHYCSVYGNIFGSKKVHKCHRLEDDVWMLGDGTVPTSMNCVRALVIIGSVMQALALVFTFMRLCGKKEQQSLFQAAGRFAVFSGILMIIAAVIFGVKTTKDLSDHYFYHSHQHFDLHAGFGLCVVSGCLAIIAGILYYRTSEDNWYPRLQFTWLQGLWQCLRSLFTRSEDIPLEILQEDRDGDDGSLLLQ